MKLNNKGMAISGILYSILVLFLVLLFGILSLLASGKYTFDKVKTDIVNKLSGIVEESPTTYTVYADGTAIYFNPVTGTECTAGEAVSTTGTKTGCMKWYAFNDAGSSSNTIDLILDHNTTAEVAWNSTGSNVNGPASVITQLQTDTSSWAGVPTRTDSYSVSNGTANYTINYSTYKARLINASEIATITGNSSFAEATATSSNWFYLDSNTQTQTATTTGASNYDWLFDYTNGCTSYGCNIADASNYGYWTSTAVSDDTESTWLVGWAGSLYNDVVQLTESMGVRPVITISKSSIKEEPPTTPDFYANGTAVYFNPVTGAKCTTGEAVSTTGTKTGCMKWYTFNDGGASTNTINLVLDHNTTALVAWDGSTWSNVNGPANVLTQLQDDTSSWAGVPTRTDSYSVNNGTATYTINYSTYKARLITAAEIATITGNSSFVEATTPNTGWFYLDSNNKTQTATTTGASNYDWLFDYTNDCTSYGCNIADASNYGYWTSTAISDTLYYAWVISWNGYLDYAVVDSVDLYGVRPVITILKSNL